MVVLPQLLLLRQDQLLRWLLLRWLLLGLLFLHLLAPDTGMALVLALTLGASLTVYAAARSWIHSYLAGTRNCAAAIRGARGGVKSTESRISWQKFGVVP